MKVLQILYSGVGGTSSVGFSLIKGDENHKCLHEFIFIGKEKLHKNLASFCKNNKIKFYDCSGIKNFLLREILILICILKSKPNIVLLHGFNIFSVIILKIFKSFKSYYVEHTPYDYRNYKNIIVFYFLLFFFNNIIFLNSFYKSKIIKKSIFFKKLIKKKIFIINNGIFLAKRKKNLFFKKKREFKIGMLSRFSSGKYQMKLIKIFDLLLSKNRFKKKIILELVGYGENYNKCKNYAKKLKIEKNIIFKKSLRFDQLEKWYSSLDLYCHLSKDEAMSTAILYALAYGKLVLATKNNGNFFLLSKKKGKNALLVEGDDCNKYVCTIKKIIQNKNNYKKIAINGLYLYQKKFTDKIMFNNYLNLFFAK